MKVLIDADGCPVVDFAIEKCRETGVSCILLCDTAHELQRNNARTVVVDKGADSVDYVLVNMIEPGDLVITQDYGLAAMCLSRKVRVLHQDGWEYTKQNIDGLLFQRHQASRYRASGGRLKGPKKRTNQQNQAFSSALSGILQTLLHG